MRVVASMDEMFDSNHNPFSSFCGFYWMTSGAVQLQFGVVGKDPNGLIPDISIDAGGTICHCPAVSEGDTGHAVIFLCL